MINQSNTAVTNSSQTFVKNNLPAMSGNLRKKNCPKTHFQDFYQRLAVSSYVEAWWGNIIAFGGYLICKKATLHNNSCKGYIISREPTAFKSKFLFRFSMLVEKLARFLSDIQVVLGVNSNGLSHSAPYTEPCWSDIQDWSKHQWCKLFMARSCPVGYQPGNFSYQSTCCLTH